MSAIARRYARAAFEAVAEKAGAPELDTLATDLQRLADTYAASPELQEALRNPVLKDARGALLATLCGKLSIGGVAGRLLGLLAHNGRIVELPNVAAEVQALVDAHGQRLRAVARTPAPLDAGQEERLKAALQTRLGKPVALSIQVEPDLLGGLVVQVGDLTFDTSLRRQLEILTERLSAHV